MLYTFGGKAPQVDPTAFVSASAELIGDVIVGPRCYIGPYAVIRADASRIVLEEEVAVEDGVIIHTGGEELILLLLPRRCGCDFGPGTGFGLPAPAPAEAGLCPGGPSDGPDGGEGDRGTL